jgi:hypothetical protein
MTYPITPPPELVRQWLEELYNGPVSVISPFDQRVLIAAAQWGSDQELEACCNLLTKQGFDVVDDLRAARRPKPPSLKEQALMALEDGDTGPGASLTSNEVDIIRRALEQLPE